MLLLDPDKPAIEYIDGHAHRKMSPKRPHGRLQFRIITMLDAQGGRLGEVGVEWTTRLSRKGEPKTWLVPDVSWMSYERLLPLSEAEREEPPISPEIVAEIRSPGESTKRRERKVEHYFARGAQLVLDVDPATRTVRAYDADGVREFGDVGTITHAAFPWLALDCAELFRALEIPNVGGKARS